MCGLMFISNPSKIMEFMHGFKKIARRGLIWNGLKLWIREF